MTVDDINNENLIDEVDLVFKEQSKIVETTTNPFIKAIIGTVPFAGGASSLLGDVSQKRQEIRLRKFLIQVAYRIKENEEDLRKRIDFEYLHSDDFCAVVDSLLQEASRTADVNKLSFLKDFMISATLHDRPDVSWKELFLNYIKQLSGIHLVILSIIYDVQGKLPSSDRIGGSEILGKVPYSISQIEQKLPKIDPLLVKISCIDLSNLGLIVDWRYVRLNYAQLQDKYCLCDSGFRFIEFIRKSKYIAEQG